MIEIDGSGGGGQILRTSLALSAILEKPFRMVDIRGNRKSPGLKNQHLKAVNATAELCRAEVKGNEIGSERIEFVPQKIRHRPLDVKIDTAGSIGLLFQALQLPASHAGEPLEINVHGGATFGKWAPTLPYVQNVFLPVIKKTGYRAEIKTKRHGFYPKGGAEVRFRVKNSEEFEPLELTERGDLKNVRGISIASEHLRKPEVAKRQAEAAERMLEEKGYPSQVNYRYVDADNPGSGITLWAIFENNVVGGDSVGERGKPSEKVGKEAAGELLTSLNSKAPLDKYMADQILPFLALAAENGASKVKVDEVTDHCETNQRAVKKFLDVEFEREGNTIRCRRVGN